VWLRPVDKGDIGNGAVAPTLPVAIKDHIGRQLDSRDPLGLFVAILSVSNYLEREPAVGGQSDVLVLHPACTFSE
jgi:hypothetical protein